MDLINHIQQEAIKKHNDNIEAIFIEGLKLKGYEFPIRHELEQFIKQACRCEDFQHQKCRIYYVRDEPFLEWHYTEPEIKCGYKDFSTTFTIQSGSYRYL